MALIHHQGADRSLSLQDTDKARLYRELFPYTSICRTSFDGILLALRPAARMRITDTTFRDGQQARPPYTVCARWPRCLIFCTALAEKSGLIESSEFFLYSPRDRKCVDVCRARGYRFPASLPGYGQIGKICSLSATWNSRKPAC